MNRDDALLYLKPRFDKLMLGIERGVDDDIDGYASSIDAAFYRYISLNGLSTNLTNTVVEDDDAYGFGVLLSATTYDMLLPSYATLADISVDAPLMNVKLSQTYRALKDLRDDAWKEAAEYGYFQTENAGGFVLQLTHNEPSPFTLSDHHEFG
jgi:hypothetical protein